MRRDKIFTKNAILVGLVVVLLFVSIVEGIILMQIHRSSSSSPVTHALREQMDETFNLPDLFGRRFSSKDWNPMEEFNAMQEQMERMFDDSYNRLRLSPFFDERDDNGRILPQTDLEDLGDRYLVTMNLPGAEQGEIEVTVQNDTLKVTAHNRIAKNDKQGDAFLRMERRSGSFQRSLSLPGPVDEKKMKTEYANGVLTITLPKRAS